MRMLDFGEVFGLDVSGFELFVRTSVIYLLLVLAMRFLARREAGSLELPDLLMVVLIADGVQNGMSGAYSTVTGAIIVGGTIIGWNFVLTYLMYKSGAARRLLRPSPLLLVQDGALLRRNMRKEFVTADEVLSMLRTQGIYDLSEVQSARLEADGQISVRKADGEGSEHNQKKQHAGQ
jgi:uncharacterized membrane protein YcaP (DUF421 family)